MIAQGITDRRLYLYRGNHGVSHESKASRHTHSLTAQITPTALVPNRTLQYSSELGLCPSSFAFCSICDVTMKRDTSLRNLCRCSEDQGKLESFQILGIDRRTKRKGKGSNEPYVYASRSASPITSKLWTIGSSGTKIESL